MSIANNALQNTPPLIYSKIKPKSFCIGLREAEMGARTQREVAAANVQEERQPLPFLYPLTLLSQYKSLEKQGEIDRATLNLLTDLPNAQLVREILKAFPPCLNPQLSFESQ